MQVKTVYDMRLVDKDYQNIARMISEPGIGTVEYSKEGEVLCVTAGAEDGSALPPAKTFPSVSVNAAAAKAVSRSLNTCGTRRITQTTAVSTNSTAAPDLTALKNFPLTFTSSPASVSGHVYDAEKGFMRFI